MPYDHGPIVIPATQPVPSGAIIDYARLQVTGSTLTDEGTLGRDATLVSASVVVGGGPAGGDALNTGGYVDLGTDDPIVPKDVGAFTVSFWVKQLTAATTSWYWADRTNDGVNWGETDIYRNSGSQLTFNPRQTGWTASPRASLTSDTNWHHIVAVYDRSGALEAALWADNVRGTPVALADADLYPSTATAGTRIGRSADGTTNFTGLIAFFRMWDRALIATEIAELYLEGGGT